MSEDYRITRQGTRVRIKRPDILIAKDAVKPTEKGWYKDNTEVFKISYIDVGDAIAEALGYDLKDFGYIIEWSGNHMIIAFVHKDPMLVEAERKVMEESREKRGYYFETRRIDS